MGCWWSVELVLGLASDFIDWGLVGELGDELVSLDVDVLLAWRCFRRFDISCEELLGGFCPLLFEAFWVVFALVGLEQLVGVRSCRDDHGGIGTSTEDSLVVGYVLRVVLFLLGSTVRILVLGFVRHNAWMCGEAGGSILGLLLGKHF